MDAAWPTRSALHHVLLLLHQLAHACGLVFFDVVDKLPLLIFLPIVDHVDSWTLCSARHACEAAAATLKTQT